MSNRTKGQAKSQPGGWPAVTYETLPWSLEGRPIGSRSALRKHQGDYQAALPPSIANQTDLGLDAETFAHVEDASTEATRFDAEFGTDILPFSSLLLRSESVASSRIENLTASARTVALAEISDHTKQNGQIIVANVRAMTAAIEAGQHIDESSIIQIHRTLLESSQPGTVGQWRQDQAWVGGDLIGPHGALFIPPHERHVAAAMHDLIAFIDRDDIPILAHAALTHAQFETIHPFPDGNGRTGRALIHSMAVNKGLTRNVTVPLSAGLLTNVDAYFAALTSYREGSTNEIVKAMADSVLRSVANGRELVSNLRAQHDEWQATISARSDAALWRVIKLIFRHPVIDSNLVQTELDVPATTALAAIERLVTEDVLRQLGGGKWGRKWEAPAVLEELDAFVSRGFRHRRRQKHRQQQNPRPAKQTH